MITDNLHESTFPVINNATNVARFPNTQMSTQVSQSITSESLGNGVDIRTLGFEESTKAIQQLRERQITILIAANASKSKKPNTVVKLSIDTIIKILRLCLTWTVINKRLAFWDSRIGIYNTDLDIITTIISIAEPVLGEKASKDAFFALKEAANRDIMLHTEPFEHRYSDTHRYVTFKNGIYDLETNTMLPHTPENFVIRQVNINFTPDAPNVVKPDGWNADDWFGEMAYDKETEYLFLQMIRVAIQPRVMEKSIWFFAETGRNGKGTLVELFYQLLGVDHIANVKVNQFNERFIFDGLERKLAIIGDDVPANTYIKDEGVFKNLHTGEVILTEAKNKDQVPVRFSGLILQTTNELPRFRDKSGGLYRRILPVEFKSRFTEETVNYNIKNKYLRDEMVLSHYVARALALPDFDHYIEPERSLIALGDFKVKNDNTVQFLEWADFDLTGDTYADDIASDDTTIARDDLLEPMLTLPWEVIWTSYLQYCNLFKKSFLDESTARKTIEDQLAKAGWKRLGRVREYEPSQITKYFQTKGIIGSVSKFHAMANGAPKQALTNVYIRNVEDLQVKLGDYCPYNGKKIAKLHQKYLNVAENLRIIN